MSSENATAAKDEYGNCVQVVDGDQAAYDVGLCERVANCYWEEPREYLERERRYSDEQYEADERAARDYMQSVVLAYGTLGFVLALAVFAGCAKFAVRRLVDVCPAHQVFFIPSLEHVTAGIEFTFTC